MGNKFKKLTPERNIDLGIYEDALNYALSEEDVRNIAVSGAYGAGKSSVIESYEEKHPEVQFLHISLAHFDEVGEDSEEDGESTSEKKSIRPEVQLEGKILNQLIHQVNPERIPLTNFKVKREAETEQLWTYTLGCAGFCVLLFFIKYNKAWCELISRIRMDHTIASILTSGDLVIVAGILFLAILVKGIYTLFRLQMEKKLLRKISLQGNDIEILENCNDSYFDKYLNEVLYLFENVNANAIVFEDIDRFGTNTIFEKLREINTLLKSRQKSLRFIYLLRDDIFESSDRAKFFDFVIPVVPVIDSSNSSELLTEYFKEAGFINLFSKEFLESLCLFIDDMRILKNIENEFLIYKGKLGEKQIELNWNMLLALITYKNLFPKDFGELQLRRGYVYTLFQNKEKLRKIELHKLDAAIVSVKKSMSDSEKEFCQNIDELNALYFLPGECLKVNEREEESFPDRAAFVAEIMKNPNQVEYYRYTSWYKFDVQKVIDQFQKEEGYKERKKNIERKSARERQRMQMQISELERQKVELESAWLKDMITRENEEQIFGVAAVNPLGEEEYFEEIKRSPYFDLIKYLLREGYIDETYPDYMTYFYGNSMSVGDKNFLRSVLCKKAKPYNYSLENLGLVMEKLKTSYFAEVEVLNFELLDYILENEGKYEEQLVLILKQIVKNSEAEFLEKYLLREKYRRKFTDTLNLACPEVCAWILEEEGLEDVRKNYVIDTLSMATGEELEELNWENVLKKYVETHEEILSVSDEDASDIVNGILSLHAKMKNLDYENANAKIVDQIYQNNAYELNAGTVNTFLEYRYHMKAEAIDWAKNLTQIFAQEEEPLAVYVQANLSGYMDVVIQNTNVIRDDEKVVLYILNHEDISEEGKHAYIECLETTIEHLADVKNADFWAELMERNLACHNSQNMCDYYFASEHKNGLGECLVHFINGSKEPITLGSEGVIELYGEKKKGDMLDDVVCCNELENDKYEKLVESFDMFYNEFNLEGIVEDKMQILIRNEIISMSGGNFTFVKENYPTCIAEFVQRNLKTYLEIIEEGQVEDEADLQHLWKLYPTGEAEINEKIEKLAEEHIRYLITEKIILPFPLLSSILEEEELDEDDRKKLLANHLKNLTHAQTVEAFSKMRLLGAEYISLLAGKRPSFECTEANKCLLDGLLQRGWISSYAENPQDPGRYRANGKKRRA